jgi:putative ABC transport system permease protein
MSPSCLVDERTPAPALPPQRRPTWPRWRPAMRLALRDARGNWGRSVLVIALVALPVALVVGAYLFGTSRTWGDLQLPRESLGTAAAGSAEPVGAEMGLPLAPGWADTLPGSWRLVPWPAVAADPGGPMGGEGVGGAAGDFADPVVGGQVDLEAGRVPSSADEVVITPGLARSAGLEVGDTWTAVLWSWAGVGENRVVPLTVVGIGDVAGPESGASFVLGGVPPGWASQPTGAERLLIDSPTPITADQVAAAAREGVRVVARDVPIEDPDRLSLTLTDELVVGLGVAFLQIVVLAGAAFAVSLRRRQRELALLSAAGAEPGDLTRAVLASGILLGGIGALVGVALPWLVLVAGRPMLEWQFGWSLAPVPPMELGIVLVPIVGLLAAVAASIVPARMAARIPLARALRARDAANVGLDPAGRGTDRLPVRSALAGVALIVAGVLFLVAYPPGSAGQGVGGWPIWALGLAVVVCEAGVVLLAPTVLALVSGHSRALPLSARLASRDASRNRLRSSFAVAAVAMSVGLLAGCLTWLSSVETAVRDAYRPAAAPGALVLARSTDQVRWGQLGSEDLSAVAAEFPEAQVALIGVGPTWDVRAGDSLAIGSQCDPLTELGVAGEALGIMDPAGRASLASGLAADDPCRAPAPAGSPVGPVSVIGGMAWEQRPGLVVADADGAAILIGRDDPVVRAQLESGGAVALAPSSVVDGKVRIAADPRLATAGQAGPGEYLPGLQADVPAVVVDSPYAPAAVIVAPQALESLGLPVPSNAVVVVPTTPIPRLQPLSGEGVSPAGLQVMSVETGPPPSSLGRFSGGPLALGPLDLGWGLVVLPLAFALLATVLVTGLALGDARPELATMAAVGASPRVRRRFAMWAAVVVSAVGSVLGAVAGIAPAWAAVRSVDVIMDPAACLWSPVHPHQGQASWLPEGMVYCDVPLAIGLDVPWDLLALVVVGLPAVAGLLFLVFTRARVPLPRR